MPVAQVGRGEPTGYGDLRSQVGGEAVHDLFAPADAGVPLQTAALNCEHGADPRLADPHFQVRVTQAARWAAEKLAQCRIDRREVDPAGSAERAEQHLGVERRHARGHASIAPRVVGSKRRAAYQKSEGRMPGRRDLRRRGGRASAKG